MAIHLHSPDENGFILNAASNFLDIVTAGGLMKNIVLPTDSTTKALFERLSDKSGLQRAFGYQQLDDYVGMEFFGRILAERLLDPLNIRVRSVFNARATDFEAERLRMAAHLATKRGKINAAILGVGQKDGHIGMHFPGVPFERGVQVAKIPDWMIKHNKTYAPEGIELPDHGYTLGVADFNDVDFLTVVAGPRPARMMHKAFSGAVTPDVPVSFVRNHAERLGDRLVILTWGPEYDGWTPNLSL